MIDSEDRTLLLTWIVKYTVIAVGVIFGVLSTAVTLGAAWRLFDLVRG